jgi:hypothetical protein
MTTPDLSAEQPDPPRDYPRLTEAQKARILADLLMEYHLNNLRPVLAAVRQEPHEQLHLFDDGNRKIAAV